MPVNIYGPLVRTFHEPSVSIRQQTFGNGAVDTHYERKESQMLMRSCSFRRRFPCMIQRMPTLPVDFSSMYDSTIKRNILFRMSEVYSIKQAVCL